MRPKIFLDTIAFKAFINREHPKHLSVVEAFEDFARLNASLYSSILVITQIHNYLLNHLTPSIAKQFISLIHLTNITILRPTPRDEKEALAIIVKPTAYSESFTDTLHIAMLQRKSITKALSSSPHFPQHNISLISA